VGEEGAGRQDGVVGGQWEGGRKEADRGKRRGLQESRRDLPAVEEQSGADGGEFAAGWKRARRASE